MKIKEIQLFANNIEQIFQFYNQTLELPVRQKTVDSVSFNCGATVLTFLQTDEIANPYYHFAFNISEHKIDLALNWLKERGVLVNPIDGHEVEFSKSWDSHSIYFYDSAGNIVEFIARHRQRSESVDQEFTIQDIVNISEIGLPSQDVLVLSEYIRSEYKEVVYIDGNHIFTPIGDEEGLFILSSLQRNWLGSNKKVNIYPVQVVILGAHEQTILLPEHPYTIRQERASDD